MHSKTEMKTKTVEVKLVLTLLGLPYGSDGRDSTCSTEDPGSIPGSGRCPGEGHGNPLQYSCPQNSMKRET